MNINETLYTKVPLKADNDGIFRILMVSDIHGGRGFAAEQTARALDALVEEAKPGLVFFAGDTCGPGVIHVENEEDLRGVLDVLSAPMEKREIAWANVFGNHDDNFGLDNKAQEKIYETYPHCVSKEGEEGLDGNANFFLPIYNSDGSEILYGVYGFDTHSGIGGFFSDCGLNSKTLTFSEDGTSDLTRFGQVKWYYETSEALEKYCGHRIPSVMFMHVPLPEVKIIEKNREETGFEGTCGEEVSCSALNPGLFAACLVRGDVRGIFCGHDHENDFVGTYCGVKLGYDGFLSYHACHRNEMRGGRIIDFMPDGTINTRMLRVSDLLGES